ncbi:MAG: CBS domain-containing protein [Pyrinomonadaceae bacterium]
MLYLSQILGAPILDRDGEQVAKIRDVVVQFGEDEHPPLIGLVARYRRRLFFMPSISLKDFSERGIRLNTDVLDLSPFARREGEILLARDVLDRQLIDVDGKRVVRVNDVQLIEVGHGWHVTGADVSMRGLWRRLMPIGFYGSSTPIEVIDWADVGYLATDTATANVQLKSSKDKLARLHPVEIAALIESLSPIHRTEIVESLDFEIAADTLEEMDEESQARILDEMDEERAADILEHMSPDDAVDVLNELSEEKAEELFDLMEGEEKENVAELLSYKSDTAGGLMTTEFLTIPRNLTVGETLARLREMAETPNMIYYLYVTEEENSWKLSGVISLRSIILSDPNALVEDVMRDEFQSAAPDDDAEDAAQKISEYNLLALPVVDEIGDILGIITVDDAMEILIPDSWQKRLPRLLG